MIMPALNMTDITNLEISITFMNVFYSLLVSGACAFFVKFFYIHYGRSLSNREQFSNVFLLLAVTTTIVITVVKFSLALSLGLVGALSIVRFRAAIKEPEELVYLFLVIAVGLSAGANQYLVAFVLTGFVGVVVVLQHKFSRRKKETVDTNVLQLTVPGDSYKSAFEQFFSKMSEHCAYCKLKTFSRVGNVVSMGFVFELLEGEVTVMEFLSEMETLAGEGVTIKLSTNVAIAE